MRNSRAWRWPSSARAHLDLIARQWDEAIDRLKRFFEDDR